MCPPVAVAAVGVGLSAAAAVSQMSAQQKQAKAQEDALNEQATMSQERAALAAQQYGLTQKWAGIQYQREQSIADAQETQAKLSITEQVIQQRLQRAQTAAQAKGVRSQAEQATAQLLTQAANQQQDAAVQNNNQSSQLAQQADEMKGQGADSRTSRASQTGVAASGLSGALSDVRDADKLVEGLQQTENDIASRQGAAELNKMYSQRSAALTKSNADLQAGYLEASQALQNEADVKWKQFARQDVRATAKRNKIAAKTAYNTALAANSNKQLTTILNEQANQAEIRANRAQITRPSFLDYAGVVVNSASQLAGSGLLRFGGSSAATATTSAPTYSGSAPTAPTAYSGFNSINSSIG